MRLRYRFRFNCFSLFVAFRSRKLFNMFRIFVLLGLPLIAFADEQMDYLQKYVGRWLGDFTIHSAATGFSETFPVEQRYWIEDGKLNGISVSDTDRGMQTATSVTFIKDGKLRSEVTRGKEAEAYWGVLHDVGIVWLPANLVRASDYQLTEFFSVEKGERWLHTDGFDTFIYKDGIAHFVYKGRLKKVKVADKEVDKAE